MAKPPAKTAPPDPERMAGAMDELAAGQYWRAKDEIPPKHATETRWVGKRYETDGRAAVEAGTVLLVQSLRFLDGELHAVVLAPHPEDGPDAQERRFLAEEFHAFFERELDPAAVRLAEIKAVEEDIQRLRQAMMEGPKDLPRLAAPKATPTVGAMVARAEDAERIRAKALQIHEIAQKRALFVQERNKELGERATTLARYHQEQATAALAAAEDTLRMAEHLQAGVQTLGLYTGEDVDVRLLRDGPEAAPEEPLRLYQRRLHMDEEWLIHALDGGADAKDIQDFGAALQKDPALVERILPGPRSVVLMAYRRLPKEYFSAQDNEPLAAAFANALLNSQMGNLDGFLLVRNGGKIWQVSSPLAAKDAERLFPTAREIAEIYKTGGDRWRGVDATQMTAADLRFTDRRLRHDEVALFYKRLLVLLWGLNDRLGLFGAFYDRARWTSWLSLDFQRERFVFVHDDEDALEDKTLPSLEAFVQGANAFLQPGSRIAVVWRKIMTSKTAPGAVKLSRSQTNERDFFHKDPAARTGLAVVSRRGEEMVVSVPCKDHWKPGELRNVVVSLTRLAEEERYDDGLGFLCLDAVRAADIDHFINSRRRRERYLAYVPLFIEARNRLRAEEAEARPFVRSLKDGLAAAKIAEGDAAERAVLEAVRLWRAAGYGRAVPTPAERSYKATLKAVGRVVFALLGRLDLDLAALEAALAAAGRSPLRLVVDRTGALAVYATPRPDEEVTLGTPHPWAARSVAELRDGAVRLGEAEWTQLRRSRATEAVVRDWPEAASWIDRPLPESATGIWDGTKPGSCSYASARRLAGLFAAERPDAAALLAGRPLDARATRRWMERLEDVRRKWRSDGLVVRPRALAPLMLLALEDAERRKREAPYTPPLRVVSLGADAFDLVLRLGKDGPEAVAQWIRDVYARPASHVEALQKRRPRLRLHVQHTAALLEDYDDRGFMPGYHDDGLPLPESVAAVPALYRKTHRRLEHEKIKVTPVLVAPWAEDLLAAARTAWPSSEDDGPAQG